MVLTAPISPAFSRLVGIPAPCWRGIAPLYVRTVALVASSLRMPFALAIPLLAALCAPPLVSRQQAVLLGGRAAGAAAAWRRAVLPAAAFTEEDCAS